MLKHFPLQVGVHPVLEVWNGEKANLSALISKYQGERRLGTWYSELSVIIYLAHHEKFSMSISNYFLQVLKRDIEQVGNGMLRWLNKKTRWVVC